MRKGRHPIRRRAKRLDWRDQRGVTLIELLTVMGMLAILMGAILPSLFAATRQGNRQNDRIASLDNNRDALDAMTRELRQASGVTSANGRVIDFTTRNTPTGTQHTIRFDCSQPGSATGKFKCVRSNLTVGGSRIVIDGIVNSTSPAPFVYTAATAGGRPRIQIEFHTRPASASRSVILRNEASMRVTG
jgi:prepilin-type N-terminal cleavage/methylation domain-containing protein